jgi:chemotaxis protein CheD
MMSIDRSLLAIYLKPGEAHLTTIPSIVTTVLGSCLSVTLWHRRLPLGAICHALLPQCRVLDTCRTPCEDRFRYVDCSIRWMMEQFLIRGLSLREIEVKMFGGADMFDSQNRSEGNIQMGKQNTDTALNIFKGIGVSLVSHQVGGLKGRKIMFNTGNGEVLHKHLVRAEE